MIIAGAIKDLSAAVHLAADGSQVATGTIYCVVRLESGDADDGKYWDSDDDTWQASPVAWPTATHTQAGMWVFALPAAATTGKAGATIGYTFTDNLTEASATTVCGGGEHHVWTENPLATADIPSADITAIKGKTDNLPTDPADQSLLVAQHTAGQVITAAIQAKTDNLPTDPADHSLLMAEHATTLAAIPTVGEIDIVLTANHGSGSWQQAVGGGAFAVNIITEEADTTPISSVFVSIYTDSGRTNLFATLNTGVTGTFTGLGMNAATYYWAAAKAGASFTSGSFVVSASGDQTLVGVVSAPSLPSAANLCVIYGTVRDAAGVPLIGTEVDAYASTPQVVSAVQMGKRIASATTDAVGYFELELEKLTEVRFTIEDAGRDETLTVPNTANQDIATWT